jgi:predicted signal transduction protein with EAL and GGDEF domain
MPNATTKEEILRKADVALYRAKAERRSAMRFFEPSMDHHIHEHDRMERESRAALAADAVRAVFEPSINLASGQLVGFAAMPRCERRQPARRQRLPGRSGRLCRCRGVREGNSAVLRRYETYKHAAG